MTFDEYELAHERCEMYKASAIKAICAIVDPYIDSESVVPCNSYLYSIRDGVLVYHIQIGGYNMEGTMMKSTLQLAIDGKVEEAKINYESEKNLLE